MVGLVLVGGAIVLASTGPRTRGAGPPLGHVELIAGGHVLANLTTSSYVHTGVVDRAALSALVTRRLASVATERVGPATVSYRYDGAAVASALAGLGARGGRLQLGRQPLSSVIEAPVVKQALRNDCEATALEMILATQGRHVSQLVLQAQVTRDGPPDPAGSGAARVWGDPELGFVGRADGGGLAGGYGVYQRPIRALALRHGVALDDLTGRPVQELYDRVLSGRAVLAWVGLEGGYAVSWHSPRGRLVAVNSGEHAVVLTGMRANGYVTVHDPLTGSSEVWSRSLFELMWGRLGQRALSPAL